MPKFKAKPHKGLLKRIRITKSGKIKHQRSGGRHLRSNKNGEQIRGLRKPGYLWEGDVKRIRGLLIGHLKIRPKKTDSAVSHGTEGGSAKAEGTKGGRVKRTGAEPESPTGQTRS